MVDLGNALEPSNYHRNLFNRPYMYIRIRGVPVLRFAIWQFIAITLIKLDAEISACPFVRERNYCQRARAKHVFGITDAMYRK